MGLDMYLDKKYYVKNWDHAPAERRHKITIKKGGKKSPIPTDKITYIETNEVYWRKANAIHKWFVDHCQDGVDKCQDTYVGREQLKELLDTVNKVLDSSKLIEAEIENGFRIDKGGKEIPIMVKGKKIEDPTTAAELLPTASGFFFGGTEYDEYYYEDLVHTKTELTRLLEAPDDDGDFIYHSSW